MVRDPGRVFTRLQLIHAALGYDFEGFERTIDVHIKNLRKKMEPDPRNPRYIKTIFGVGYKFDPEG
jgi:DNA-binding response OmpR family regulator